MKLSAVIELIDGFTGKPAVGAPVRFELDGIPCQAQAKGQAFYAFPNLTDGQHRLAIFSMDHIFFDQNIALDVPLATPLAEAIVACVLAPSPIYDFPAGTTLIRGKIIQGGKAGSALAGVDVGAAYQNVRAGALRARTVSCAYGRYNGRYALALGGKLAAPTSVQLDFAKSGYADVQKKVALAPGAVLFVDIEMH
ncbi:carboxypeptidase regulatory-like domain-containing protein [Undibacterium sp. Di26W]|uniref:carboxypeptidase regulatory-like domain-containing protein n=1 Tax=Undibacterium sp. Di26W TaxID=3413035 RepID=UPI003BF3659D